ncbi:MAG TPA: glycosyltransferase [Sphingomicrobium sp.]
MGLWQFFATIAAILGAWYIVWRWTSSLNPDALWFSIPMALGETCAYLGLLLFFYNMWGIDDPAQQPPPARIGDCDPSAPEPDRAVSVDVFITTYNEEEDLVRLSIRDALNVRVPAGVVVKVHVLDDGRRASMREIAEREGANYISRDNNLGYKAGNLRNAMEQTDGDFIVICDADTRLLPPMLENVLGYFRDPDVAFVQTPQWFYDLPPGERLSERWGRSAGAAGRAAGRAIETIFGEIRVGADPFNNDASIFYEVILRRRNRANAAFCCGAASIHRREAVMYVALRAYGDAIRRASAEKRSLLERIRRRARDPNVAALRLWEAAREEELTPYKFHVSEDIYTSIVLQQDRSRRWKSVMHPFAESRMLSPQDLLTWTIQRFKYAGGSLDILIHDNPITARGLSLPQRLMYLNTFWSYLGALWNLMFLIAPAIYLFTAIAPVSAYTADFFIRLVPFLIMVELAMLFGFWGYSGYKSKVSYLASFPLSLQALWAVIRNKPIKFHVTPKERQEGNFLHIVWPQVAIAALTLVAIGFGMVQLLRDVEAYTPEGVLANSLWGLNNVAAMLLMIRAAFWKPETKA